MTTLSPDMRAEGVALLAELANLTRGIWINIRVGAALIVLCILLAVFAGVILAFVVALAISAVNVAAIRALQLARETEKQLRTVVES